MNRVVVLLTLIGLTAACSPASDEMRRGAASEGVPSAEANERADLVERSLAPTILIEGEEADQYSLDERMALHAVPAVSVAVLRDGVLDWARAYGVADVTTGREVTTSSIFQAASISKPVAAMAALRLVEQGLITLDADVNDSFRSWRLPTNELLADRPVTLRGLLTHTAGLSVSGFPGYAAGDPIPTAVQILDGSGATNTDPVRAVTQPGTEWSYSGGGYTALQVLIEDVSKAPFAEFMKSTVLEPIGMQRSLFGFDLGPDWSEDAAFGHRPDGTLVEGRWHRYPELAAAGLWTTPTDLLRWGMEVLESARGRSNKVLSAEMTRAMLEPGLGDWGLGPEISSDGLRFLHTGGNQGYRCLLAVSKDGSVGVAVMTNSDNGGVLMTEIALAVASVYGWEGDGLEPQVRSTVPVDPAAMGSFVGRYPAPGGREVVITLEDGQLFAESEWFRKQKAHAESENTFFLLHGGTRLRFERDAGGAILRLFDMRLVKAE